jgi:hypothetical protein
MVAKLTRLAHKIAIQPHVVAESCFGYTLVDLASLGTQSVKCGHTDRQVQANRLDSFVMLYKNMAAARNMCLVFRFRSIFKEPLNTDRAGFLGYSTTSSSE